MRPTVIAALLLLAACSRSEVVERPPTRSMDTSTYIPREQADTAERTPISFDVTVNEWEEN